MDVSEGGLVFHVSFYVRFQAWEEYWPIFSVNLTGILIFILGLMDPVKKWVVPGQLAHDSEDRGDRHGEP